MNKIEIALRKALQVSQDEEEFPNYLAEQVLVIADNIVDYEHVQDMILKLIFMVSDYNTYAETCCEKIGTSHQEVENQLKKIKETL